MSKSTRQEFFEGVRDCLPIMVAVGFFGLLFGATGVNNNLTLWQTLGSSASVFAGASQFVFLELYNQQVPVWSVLLAVFAINFRHILYSASIGRVLHRFTALQKYVGFFVLSDPLFGAGEQRAEQQGLSPAYYFGFGASLYPIWIGSTLLGALMGNLISNPRALGMDMLLSIYFLTLLIGFKSRPNWLTVVLASGIASSLIYKFIGSPWHIMLGAFVGIGLAAIIGKPVARNEQGEADA
jgi:predicted branched-subunit amino acid permease